jgi:hypothetical protein
MIQDPGDETIPAESARSAADSRRLAQEAAVRARALVNRHTWRSDPGLRVQVELILASPPEERLRQLEATLAFFAAVRPAP